VTAVWMRVRSDLRSSIGASVAIGVVVPGRIAARTKPALVLRSE
jgi:hypothetical protein